MGAMYNSEAQRQKVRDKISKSNLNCIYCLEKTTVSFTFYLNLACPEQNMAQYGSDCLKQAAQNCQPLLASFIRVPSLTVRLWNTQEKLSLCFTCLANERIWWAWTSKKFASRCAQLGAHLFSLSAFSTKEITYYFEVQTWCWSADPSKVE